MNPRYYIQRPKEYLENLEESKKQMQDRGKFLEDLYRKAKSKKLYCRIGIPVELFNIFLGYIGTEGNLVWKTHGTWLGIPVGVSSTGKIEVKHEGA